MKQMFSQHHRLSEAERNELWKQCIFTLDANALLNIYRYADSTRGDLFKVLEMLNGRVWIPYQAAKEFYKNRITIIKEQKKKYDDLQSGLDKVLGNLKGGDFSKSAFLKIAEIEAVLKPAVDKASQEIAKWRAEHPDLLHEDPFLERLAGIIGEAIGQEPEKADFDKLCERARERISNKQPPGYMDEKKPEPDRYGDVLVWFELFEHAKAITKPIMFLTDDAKEDWWQIESGEKLGPRPELREEMRRIAGVDFFLASPAHFLEIAESELKLGVSQSSVENATEVAAQVVAAQTREQVLLGNQKDSKIRNDIRGTARVQLAVADWLQARFPLFTVSDVQVGPFDFVVKAGETLIAFDVQYMSFDRAIDSLLELRRRSRLYRVPSGKIAEYWLFVVIDETKWAQAISDVIGMTKIEHGCGLSIGYLTPLGQYEELVRRAGDGTIFTEAGRSIGG